MDFEAFRFGEIANREINNRNIIIIAPLAKKEEVYYNQNNQIAKRSRDEMGDFL